MKQINTILYLLCFFVAPSVFLSSCSDEANSTATGSIENLNTNEQSTDSAKEEIELAPIENKEVEFIQASNGLEYAVVQYYVDLYDKGELKSIVKGSARKMNPKENKVYLDSRLYAFDGLDFFHGKYPEFLIPKKDSVQFPDASYFKNTRVNCKRFVEGKASDYLMKRENYQQGDLQLMISKAIYYNGAYFVHAWEISNSTNLFHYQRITYKFDKKGQIVDHAGINTYQTGYNKVAQFLRDQDTPDEKSIPTVRE